MAEVTLEQLEKGFNELKEQHSQASKELKEQVLAKSEEGVQAAHKRFEEVDAQLAELQAKGAELEAKIKQQSNGDAKPEHFNDVLAKTLDENSDKIAKYSKGDKVTFEMKAAGNMSTSNFAGTSYANITTDYRQSVLPLPTERIWMRDVLPSGTTSANNIWYPKHTGGEGKADVWSSGNKPQMDFDFTGVNDPVRWIAGIVKVPREMLDDVPWLKSFLQQNMLLSLYKTENYEILNGDGTGDHLKGIIPQATAYDGDYTIAVERLVDAGYGQIDEANGAANVVMLHPRDAVAIALNKASGSGEYDLPPGTVGFVNGRLTIAGMTVVRTKEITKGQFLVGDNMASQFVTRLKPELQMFEQNEDDARNNLIMFRIEERAALATYYPQWWVKGDLAPETP